MTSILDNEQLPPTDSIDPEKDYLFELVGEGKKFADAKALARAKAEADLMVERLKFENAQAREDIKANRATKRMEEMLDQLQNFQTRQTPSNSDNQTREQQQSSPPLTPEDIEKIIEQREVKRSVQQNRDLVVDKMISAYGPNYASKIKEAATQLKVDPSFLDNLAVNKPEAFFKLIGYEERQQEVSVLTPPRGSTTFAPSTSKKNFAYYEQMRKKEPDRYHSISTQNEMWSEAVKQQESFYN